MSQFFFLHSERLRVVIDVSHPSFRSRPVPPPDDDGTRFFFYATGWALNGWWMMLLTLLRDTQRQYANCRQLCRSGATEEGKMCLVIALNQWQTACENQNPISVSWYVLLLLCCRKRLDITRKKNIFLPTTVQENTLTSKGSMV